MSAGGRLNTGLQWKVRDHRDVDLNKPADLSFLFWGCRWLSPGGIHPTDVPQPSGRGSGSEAAGYDSETTGFHCRRRRTWAGATCLKCGSEVIGAKLTSSASPGTAAPNVPRHPPAGLWLFLLGSEFSRRFGRMRWRRFKKGALLDPHGLPPHGEERGREAGRAVPPHGPVAAPPLSASPPSSPPHVALGSVRVFLMLPSLPGSSEHTCSF